MSRTLTRLMRRPPPRAIAVLAVAVALVVAGGSLAACGGSSKKKNSVALVPSTSTSTAGSSSATVPAITAPVTAAPGVAAPVFNWQDCGDGFQCTKIHPPLDYARPDAGTVDVAVARLPASGAKGQRIGSLFVNPGGPGAGAVDFARTLKKALPATILAHFDLVAFDPRSAGGSDPIACESGPELDKYFAVDPSPDNAAEHDQLVAANRQFALECAQRAGALLGHVDTRTAARDMDFIRSGLSEDKISYLGFSYGTFLGAMYADMFPARVRAFILDGAIDPSIGPDEINREQAAGFERSLSSYFADCAAHVDCPFNNGGDPRSAFNALAAAVDRTPLPTTSGRVVGPGEFLLGVIRPLYRQDDWNALSLALAEAQQSGKGDRLLAMSDDYTERQSTGEYGNLLSSNTAVNCIDHPWATDVAHYDQLAQQFSQQSPVFGAALAYGGMVCGFWQAPATDVPRPLHAVGAAPIVVVGTTGDPATPYQWAQALAGQLQSGVLLTNQGEGHTAFASNSACIKTAETRYLIELKPPARGTVCKS